MEGVFGLTVQYKSILECKGDRWQGYGNITNVGLFYGKLGKFYFMITNQ
jgi:hypothetical protein